MSDPKDQLKHLGTVAGRVLTALGLGFVIWAIWSQWGQVRDWQPTIAQFATIAGLSVAYAAILILPTANWAAIVAAFLPDPPPMRKRLLSYSKSQLAKYVPGNVMHLISRHIYLQQLGLPHQPLAKASFCEVIVQPLLACIAICLALMFVQGVSLYGWALSSIAPFGLIILVALTIGVLRGIHRPLLSVAPLIILRGALFMLGLGSIFAITLQTVTYDFIALAIPVAILAWLIGFLTPGAPGGIGVREAVMITLMTGPVARADILITVILFRFVTTLGDVVLYLAGNLAEKMLGNDG
ncbi:MAG: hypothetical protein AAFN63_15460 [Pseudomonadota bacterium]